LQQNPSILTPVQRRAFIWLAIALGVGILLWLLSPVLTPFLLGAILAYILQPGVAWMVRRRVPRALAALLMMLFFTLLMTLLVLLVLAVIQKEGPQLRHQVPVFFTHFSGWLQPKLALLGLADSLDFASIRDAAQHAVAHRLFGKGLDCIDQRVARVDVHASVAIRQTLGRIS